MSVGQDFVQSLGEQPAMPEIEPSDTVEDETTAASRAEDKTEEAEKPVDETPKDGEEKNKGFHEHPAWKEREEKWEKRLSDQKAADEKRFSELEAKITTRQEAHAELTEADVPEWFNGDLETYKKYHAHQTKLMVEKATEIADKRWAEKEKAQQEQTQKQEREVQEATSWFRSEVSRIEADATLNPSGEKINQEELLKVAQENDLIDSKNRWNYAAAYRILAASKTNTQKPIDPKTKLAAITSKKDSKADSSQKAIASADSFKGKGWDNL